MVKAIFRMLPSNGSVLQVSVVSLSHCVVAHTLGPARARGFEFEFEKCRPCSCNIVLPLALSDGTRIMLLNEGSGYEYMHVDGEDKPELNAATVRLRPKPDELSAPWAST